MRTHEEIYQRLKAFAREDERVRAMVLFGSRARDAHPADGCSDYDVILFVREPDAFVRHDEWLQGVAETRISFVEPTAAGGAERRVFFDGALDMDFLFYPAEDAERVTRDPVIGAWYARGYRVEVDKLGYAELAKACGPFADDARTMSAEELANLTQTFWFHTIWAAKKLLRGETWAAKQCVDRYLKTLLRQTMDARMQAETHAEIWHEGRFFDERATARERARLGAAYGAYDDASLARALRLTMDCFAEEARRAAAALCCVYPDGAEAYARAQTARLLALTARPSQPAANEERQVQPMRKLQIGSLIVLTARPSQPAANEERQVQPMRKLQIGSLIVLTLALAAMLVSRFVPFPDWAVQADGVVLLVGIGALSFSTARRRLTAKQAKPSDDE